MNRKGNLLVGAALLLVIAGPILVSRGPSVLGQVLGRAAHAGETDDQKIAMFAARMLVGMHFLQQPLSDEMSAKFLDRYLDTFDPLKIYFLESDLAEFAPLRTTLDELTWEKGDTTPAHRIFARFLERLDQQSAYVADLLKSESFTFTADEMYLLDRDKLVRPKNLEEAKGRWRQRLRYEYLQEKLNKQKPDEIVKVLTRRYERLKRALHQYARDEVFELYLTSLAHVYDPHSDYMGKSSYEDFGIRMRLSLFGIGAVLRSEDGHCIITELTPGGPAMTSGKFKVGDKIIAVAQGSQPPVDVIDMRLDKIVALIRGTKGTEVRLTIIPADAPDPSTRVTVTLIRDEIKLEEQEAKAQVIDVPAAPGGRAMRLGVIDLPSFYAGGGNGGRSRKSATDDVERLLRKLEAEKVDGVVLDLRKNGGGALEESIRLTGLFIKDGPIVQVKAPDGEVEVDRDPDPALQYGGPLVVLTSRASASASEILAGALQDYGRAVIVGDESTHGKGTVQSLLQLGPLMRQRGIETAQDPGALKLTIRKFYRANGHSTQLKGVVPDIILPSLNNRPEIGEQALDNPLPWDMIPSATFRRMNLVEPHVADLKRRSEARVAVNRDFVHLREEIERFTKALAQKAVSLNEAQRVKEREEADTRNNARQAELKARPPSSEKVHILTLKNVDQPGLPPAIAKDSVQAAPPRRALPGDDPAAEGRKPGPDAHLDEAKRILADLVRASKPAPSVTQTRR